jgi:hypothetical protein
MGRQRGTQIRGTYGNITFYKLRGKYYHRAKTSIDALRVKEDPAFNTLMQHANLLAQASRLASEEYKQLPASKKGKQHYRRLVGKMMQMLKSKNSKG